MSATLRPAADTDSPDLGRMGACLARQHHAFDPLRFMLPDDVEEGYRWWLTRELKNPAAVVLVAERGGQVVGYAYGRIEERDWNALRDRCGVLHDLWVDEAARREGAGKALTSAMIQALARKGAPRVVLSTASKNESAQRLFAGFGFRHTLIEMTREASPDVR